MPLTDDKINQDIKSEMTKKITEMMAKAHLELLDNRVKNYQLKRLIEIKNRENQALIEIIRGYSRESIEEVQMRILDEED